MQNLLKVLNEIFKKTEVSNNYYVVNYYMNKSDDNPINYFI